MEDISLEYVYFLQMITLLLLYCVIIIRVSSKLEALVNMSSLSDLLPKPGESYVYA
jgi:hypothetical protein